MKNRWIVAVLVLIALMAPALPVSADIEKLLITDVVVGEGIEALPGKQVLVHYTGWLYVEDAQANRGDKFDSSVDRDEPFIFGNAFG